MSEPTNPEVPSITPDGREALHDWVKSAASITKLIEEGRTLNLSADFVTQIQATARNIVSGLEVFAGQVGAGETFQAATAGELRVPGDALVEIERLRAEVAGAETRVTEVEDESQSLRDENERLTQEVREAEERIEELEREEEAPAEERPASGQGSTECLESQLDLAEKQIEERDEEIDSLKAEIDDLRMENEDLKTVGEDVPSETPSNVSPIRSEGSEPSTPRRGSTPEGYGNTPPAGSTLEQEIEFYKARVKHYRDRKEHYKRLAGGGNQSVESLQAEITRRRERKEHYKRLYNETLTKLTAAERKLIDAAAQASGTRGEILNRLRETERFLSRTYGRMQNMSGLEQFAQASGAAAEDIADIIAAFTEPAVEGGRGTEE